MRELARLRNAAAHALGYRDWFALSVATSEMDEEKLLATLAEADAATAEPFARWKAELDERLAARFGCAVDELAPWHYADPFFQEVPAEGGVDLEPRVRGRRPRRALAPHLRRRSASRRATVLDRSDLFPREGKCQHAFCIDVDRAGDVRVLANVVPEPGLDGHDAARARPRHLRHGASTRRCSWLLRDTHLVVTEGIAILMGRLAGDPEWLERVLGIEPGRRSRRSPAACGRARAAELLVFTRWVLVMTNFERALYADPESDLDARWWELVERYQLVRRPEGRIERRTGPPRSTSPARPSTTTPTSTGTSSPRSSPPRSSGSAAGSSTGPPPAGCSPSGSSRRGSRCAGTGWSSRRPGEPLTAAHFGRDIAAG